MTGAIGINRKIYYNMPSKKHGLHYSKAINMVLKACFVFISLFVALLTLSTPASANSKVDTLDLQVNIGFNEVLKPSAWMPVIVTLTNNGQSDFSGSIEVEAYDSGSSGIGQNMTPQSFSTPIKLAHGKRLERTLYVPFNTDPLLPDGIMVKAIDDNNQIVSARTKMISTPDGGSITIGILSDQRTGFGALKNLNLPTQQTPVIFTFLTATTLPTQTTVLDNFDAIVLDNFTTSSLGTDQINALRTWVNEGGALLEIGGASWQRTLVPLPAEIRPVTLNGAFELPAGTRLFPQESLPPASKGQAEQKTDGLNVATTASMATTRNDAVHYSAITPLTSYNDIPLFVQAQQGKGNISYLAIDPANPTLATWVEKNNVWTQLLTHALGDRLLIASGSQKYNNGQGELLTRGGVLPALDPNFSFAPLTFLLLLLGYVVFLGPIRLLLLRRLKYPMWSWRIILSGMVIFTLISYGIAIYQKNASLTNNSLSVMQLNESGSEAHVTTYMGVFVPNKGNFNIHVPGVSQVLAVTDPEMAINIYGANMDAGASISYGKHGTDVNLETPDTWTYHPMVIEQDRHVEGGVDAQLKLQGENLIGTITNHLTTAISDMYVLMPHSFVAIGHLDAGQKRSLMLPMQSTTNTDTLLADQIARSRGLPPSYFPYANQGQPQNDFQRHMAQLSILSGAGSAFIPCGGSCATHAIINNQSVVISSQAWRANAALLKDNDPLLIENAPATLIGWSDQNLDGSSDITINGSHPSGYHDTMLQMPVNMQLVAPFRLPTNYISGHIISTQASDAMQIAPNLYALSKGSVGFEFDIPKQIGPYVQILSIAIPHALNGRTFPSVSGYLQASLYNWKSKEWDKFSLYPDNLSITNPDNYMDEHGSLLLQVTNANNFKPTAGSIYFDKPSLNLF